MDHRAHSRDGGDGVGGPVGCIPGESAIADFLDAYERQGPRSRSARIFGAAMLSEESRLRYLDVIGELEVAGQLERLDRGWTVLHAVRVEASESAIDHLVIGPGGVFSLNSNYHSGQTVSVAERSFQVAGSRVHHIRDTEFDIGRVERRLTAAAGRPVPVVGVIAVVDPRALTVRDVPKDIAVVRADELVDWLRAQAPVLDPISVTEIGRAARCHATWSPEPRDELEHERLAGRFEMVRSEVRVAMITRLLWMIAMSLGLLGILAVTACGVVMQALAA